MDYAKEGSKDLSLNAAGRYVVTRGSIRPDMTPYLINFSLQQGGRRSVNNFVLEWTSVHA